jgi:tetratricopeptide (TPR) repeat protein
MAGVEPYSPCPCGSGQKFKWCCHKVEAFADKARRLLESGQAELAIKALDEGLRKEPGNPWLLTRKAVVQINQGQAEPAKATLRQVLEKNPKHFGALVLLTRCVLETEGPVNGAGMFQQVLSSVDGAARAGLGTVVRLVAILLAQARRIPAAIKHFELVLLFGDHEQAAISALRNIESSPAYSPWLKDRLELAAAPASLDEAARTRFNEALAWARQGLWASAAAVFDGLSNHGSMSEADYNLGLCRLWIGDEAGALGPIRRRSKTLGNSTEAVDLEILAQQIEPIHPDDRVEQVQLTWPLRNRDALLASLRSKADIFDDGTAPVDPEDPDSPEADHFVLLDRPAIDKHDGKGLTPDDIPRILGRIMVAQDVVSIETYDDGRVDSLGDRFTAVAGSAIAPAHPRTKILGEESKATLAMAWEWLYPAELAPEEAQRLDLEQRVKILRDIWPVTPSPFLNFRSPERAAKDGDAEVPLRAALCQYEQDRALEEAGLDFAAIRSRLNIPPEPAIDPATVDVTKLSLGRLNQVPVEPLDDDKLITLYRRSRRVMAAEALEASAKEIVARPSLFEQGKIDPVSVYSDLASLATSRGEKAEAAALITQGRAADSPARRAMNAPLWDMIEVRQKARTETPEVWVPELAIVLERYDRDESALQIILMNLVELGLVRLSPNPDDPADVLVDSRPLMAVLAEFGPRVTTASGRLGVSAAKPEVWTPGSPGGGSTGGLWTPGSGTSSPPGDKPKLILPGR